MYKDYYSLKTEPFNIHPSTDIFFSSNTHKEAWCFLLLGIETHDPYLVLSGEYGMGKTLLSLRLYKYLTEKGMPLVVYVPTPNEGYSGILHRMASCLGISPIPKDDDNLQNMIYDCFRVDTEKSRFYLIIDDAHELDITTLTKLKHLSAFNHNEFFPMVMIFLGHMSFMQYLNTPALSSLNQRIKRRYRLANFSLEDTKNYIYFRLLKAGSTGIPSFHDETIQRIFEYSRGIPRLINNICDTCLLLAASNHLTSIIPETVDEAKNLVEGTLTVTEPEAKTDSDSTDEPKTFISSSEDYQAEDIVKQYSILTTGSDKEEYQPEIACTEVSGFTKNLRNVVIFVVAGILLVLAGAVLAWFIITTNTNKTSAFSSPTILTKPQKISIQPEEITGQISVLREELKDLTKPQKNPVQPKGITVEIPTLREELAELTDKTSGEKRISTTSTESMASGSTDDTPLKRAGTQDAKPSSKIETILAGDSENFVFHPFSLRSSSYQHRDYAVQEISEIRQQGLSPYLVYANLGDMGTLWRVYIGFYTTEEEAKKIKMTHNLTNAIVQETSYACQIGEFSNETDCRNMFERVRQSGHFPYVIQKARDRFILYVGAYERKAEAEALHKELQEKGIKSQVVKR